MVMALTQRKILPTEVPAVRPQFLPATDLLPWADPYILRLFSEHEQALAQSQAKYRVSPREVR